MLENATPRPPTDADRRIGQRIAQARAEAGLNQDELGNKLGVTGATVSRWESGIHQVHASELVRIAFILSKPVAWFYNGETRPSPVGVFGYHLERLSPENRRLLEQLAEQLATRQRDPPAE